MVMAVAAAEATVGPGDRHRDLPEPQDAARRRVRRDAPMSLPRRSRTATRCYQLDRRDHRLPLAGFLLTALVGRRLGLNRRSGSRSARSSLSWLAAMAVVAGRATAAPFGERRALSVTLCTGSRPATSCVDVGFFVDNLTAVLLIVVTTIGMLVHVYSIGYMRHDPGYWRFFAYLNLFMFSMLLLVLADSFLVVFVAWELVGLSQLPADRLLVPQADARRRPSKKAFISNRVGDVGFALGIMAIFVNTRARSTSASRSSADPASSTAARRSRSAHRAAALRRRGGQERPVPAPRLAAGRDGGPDPGLRPDPRRDDGQRRRLPRRPRQPDLRAARRRRWSSSPRSASSPRSSPPRSR